jgi:hypothetical protein
MSKEIMQQALTVLKAWDALIKYQYGGSSEAMTAMQNVAWRTLDTIEGLETALAQPEQAVVLFPSFMRKRIEQAMDLAINPKGMSVHDGKTTVLVSDLHRMLLIIDSALAQPEHRFDTPESHIVKWSIPVDPNNFGEALAQPEQPDLRKAAEMALEVLERGTTGLAIRAIPALRQALAQPEQEPVAWRNAAIRLGENLYSVGPNGYYDMTAKQWLDWALGVVNTDPPKPEIDYPPECTTPEMELAYAAGWWKALEVQRNKQQALDKKADNARELGLDYEPKQEPVCNKDVTCTQTNDEHCAMSLNLEADFDYIEDASDALTECWNILARK